MPDAPAASKNKRLILTKTDGYLLLEFLTLGLCIIIGSWFHKDGFLSSDSVNYLALANNLVTGHGLYVSGYGYSGNEKDYFAIWPTGYPLLIALTAKLSSLSVFWASKAVNIILAGLSLLIFRKIFPATAHIYGLLFLFGAAIVIYTFTWSESLFIFALMGYATAAANIVKTGHDWKKHAALMLVISLLLFMARYIGAFSIISTGLLGLVIFFKHRGYRPESQKGIVLIILAGINALIVACYLYNNLTLTHYITGIPRIASPESHMELLQQLLVAVISECIITIPYLFFRPEFLAIIVIQLCAFLFFFRKKTSILQPPRNYCIYSLTFLFTGVTYLVALIILRWITHFDDFFFRLLFPGSILIFTAIIRHIEINFPERFQQLSKTLATLTTLTVILIQIEITGVSGVTAAKNQLTYAENIAKIQQRYEQASSGSVVAFGSMHLKYLRSDLLLWSPWSLPYNEKKETWSDFLIRAGEHRKIYLDYPEDELVNKIYDKSVIQQLQKQPGGHLREIR